MDGKYIYEMANSQINLTDRKQYLSTLTEEQRKLYTRYNNKIRQDKFKANEANKAKYNEIRKEHIAELRQNEPEKMKQQNIKDVRAFREREKQEIILKKSKSMNTLTDAIRARKARAELNSLKAAAAAAAAAAKQTKPKPKTKKTKEERHEDALERKREYMRQYRAKMNAKK